jgi:hypothetical protein
MLILTSIKEVLQAQQLMEPTALTVGIYLHQAELVPIRLRLLHQAPRQLQDTKAQILQDF